MLAIKLGMLLACTDKALLMDHCLPKQVLMQELFIPDPSGRYVCTILKHQQTYEAAVRDASMLTC